eukprot:6197603-Pleurochrysis_carterae.AAC.1
MARHDASLFKCAATHSENAVGKGVQLHAAQAAKFQGGSSGEYGAHEVHQGTSGYLRVQMDCHNASRRISDVVAHMYDEAKSALRLIEVEKW